MEDHIFQQALRKAEGQLGWGPSDQWSTQDFADLSEKIYQTTGVVLSVTTLKRLWGKVNYKSKPTSSTLNTLAQYIGYENWQAFRKSQDTIVTNASSFVNEPIKKPIRSSNKRRLTIITVVTVLIATGFFFSRFSPETAAVGSVAKMDRPYEFSSKMMVSEGVPNSIIFNYDATAADPMDTICIQQSWDKRLRERVLRQDKVHSSLYYHPGFFQAKLVVNDKIVKEHDLWIKTKGWLLLAEQESSPVYFENKDALTSGRLHLPLAKLRESNISLQPKTPWISYYNVRKFDGLKTDNFIFKTVVRNDYKEGAAVCQHTEIHILFKGGAFVLPLSIKGCVSGLQLYDVNGKIENTAALGCDLSRWVAVEYRVKDKKGQIFINDALAYDGLDLDLPPAEIIGLRYRFQGTGSVKSINLTRGDGKIVYEENF